MTIFEIFSEWLDTLANKSLTLSLFPARVPATMDHFIITAQPGKQAGCWVLVSTRKRGSSNRVNRFFFPLSFKSQMSRLLWGMWKTQWTIIMLFWKRERPGEIEIEREAGSLHWWTFTKFGAGPSWSQDLGTQHFPCEWQGLKNWSHHLLPSRWLKSGAEVGFRPRCLSCDAGIPSSILRVEPNTHPCLERLQMRTKLSSSLWSGECKKEEWKQREL